MPDYVRTHLPADWIDNDAPPVEQGGMTVTDAISPETRRHRRDARRAIAQYRIEFRDRTMDAW